jgi:aldose sugar dehydrogenase
LFASDFGSTSGSRIVFSGDGYVYMTTGAPFGDDAQDLKGAFGKVLRLKDDGGIPADNPFLGRDDVHPAVYSYGHRDQLGLTLHEASGTILAAEHGPNGGDEVNVIRPGLNYGWPNISFGRNYDGPRISDSPVAENVEQPLLLWVPSIGPSGLMFYTGDKFPAWKGNLFIGSARRGEVPRTGGLERVVLTENLEDIRRETLLTELHQRIRDVRQGPDGLLYVLTDGDEFGVRRAAPRADELETHTNRERRHAIAPLPPSSSESHQNFFPANRYLRLKSLSRSVVIGPKGLPETTTASHFSARVFPSTFVSKRRHDAGAYNLDGRR